MAEGVIRHRRCGSERGAELIEFALVLPILLVVFGGIIDFAFMFQRYLVVTNAAREGARLASLPNYTQADVTAHVGNYMNRGLGAGTSSNVNVGYAELPAPPQKRFSVTVTLTKSYFILGPLISLVGGSPGDFGSVTISSTSVMRAEMQGA